MTADRARLAQELLPLPELPQYFASMGIAGGNHAVYLSSQMQRYATAYAKACVAAAIEGAGAREEDLQADRDSWAQQASDRVADWHAEHQRAERMAEAASELVRRIKEFAEAYPEGNFGPVTEAEREANPSLVTRASASMGRHMGRVLLNDAAPLIAALSTKAALAASSADGEG